MKANTINKNDNKSIFEKEFPQIAKVLTRYKKQTYESRQLCILLHEGAVPSVKEFWHLDKGDI